MKNILAIEAWELLKTAPNSFLVDVRKQSEWDAVGFPDLSSINKNLIKITWKKDENDFLINLQEIIQDKDAHIMFICKAGGRSAAAAITAINGGYEHCYNVLGGFEMNGWKDNNLPYVIS